MLLGLTSISLLAASLSLLFVEEPLFLDFSIPAQGEGKDSRNVVEIRGNLTRSLLLFDLTKEYMRM
jgi:hypothetical protein